MNCKHIMYLTVAVNSQQPQNVELSEQLSID